MSHPERPASSPASSPEFSPESIPAGAHADPDPVTEAERERRLARLEEPEGGGMLQPELPLRDVLVLLAAIVVVSVALLLWARA